MATIKAYTDLEQSKKLAEILPLESAERCIDYPQGCKHCRQSGKFFGNPDFDAIQYHKDMMFQDIKVK